MTVPILPKLGTPPVPAPLRKIALEEHFGHPIVFMRDGDGRFETRKEAAVGHLGPEYFEIVTGRRARPSNFVRHELTKDEVGPILCRPT
jgi:hypothetical protein